MSSKLQNTIVSTLSSIIGIAIFITLLVLGILFFSYLLIISGIIGFILFGIAYARRQFVTSANKKKQPNKQPYGRTIDQ